MEKQDLEIIANYNDAKYLLGEVMKHPNNTPLVRQVCNAYRQASDELASRGISYIEMGSR